MRFRSSCDDSFVYLYFFRIRTFWSPPWNMNWEIAFLSECIISFARLNDLSKRKTSAEPGLQLITNEIPWPATIAATKCINSLRGCWKYRSWDQSTLTLPGKHHFRCVSDSAQCVYLLGAFRMFSIHTVLECFPESTLFLRLYLCWIIFILIALECHNVPDFSPYNLF